MKGHLEIAGTLVELPLPGRARPLDGFHVQGERRNPALLLVVHGMGGNFYRSRFKKALFQSAPARGYDVLSFNNRGYERDVSSERFTDCLEDLDAAIAWGRRAGYRRFVLLGHSTGCQKITYWQHRRQSRAIEALVLGAIGDDYAIVRKTLGRQHVQWLEKARRWISKGWNDRALPPCCLGFTPKRFLSIADRRQTEAKLFDFDGPMRAFRSIRTPVLALFPEREQYACIPVPEMASRLERCSHSRRFQSVIVSGADHSFHGAEREAVRILLDWLVAGRQRA